MDFYEGIKMINSDFFLAACVAVYAWEFRALRGGKVRVLKTGGS